MRDEQTPINADKEEGKELSIPRSQQEHYLSEGYWRHCQKSRQKLIIPFEEGNQYQKRTHKGMEKGKEENE